MSILIKGMDMPKENYKKLLLLISADGTVDITSFLSSYVQKTDATAVEVPTPHGDLIDKHIVLNEIYEYMYNRNYAVGHLYDVISEKTAVIEREE